MDKLGCKKWVSESDEKKRVAKFMKGDVVGKREVGVSKCYKKKRIKVLVIRLGE